MNNVELFNIYAGQLLVALYDNFPVPLIIRAEHYVGEPVPYESILAEPDDGDAEERAAWLAANVAYEAYEQKKKVFSATVHFLHSERLIRFLEPPQRGMSAHQPPEAVDVLISNAMKVGSRRLLHFVLTAHGLAQLSKTVSRGKITDDTLITKLKGTLASETVKAAPNAAIASALPWLGAMLGGTT